MATGYRISVADGEGRPLQFVPVVPVNVSTGAEGTAVNTDSQGYASFTALTDATYRFRVRSVRQADVTIEVVMFTHDHADADDGGGIAGAAITFAAPAFTLGTANAQGAATTPVPSNSTIAAFDATVPTTSAMGDTAATGAAAVAARRDHAHGREAFATPAIVLGTAAAAGVATTPIRSDSTIVAFDATVPTTAALGDAAATGAAAVAARRDHLHGMPASPLALASGGSNKAMTAVNGGVVWTDTDSMEVSAAGTSGQLLQSAGAAAPTWTGAPTVTNLTDSALTAGRVVVAGASGILTDDADLTFSGATLTATTISVGSGGLNVPAVAGTTIPAIIAPASDDTAGDGTTSGTVELTVKQITITNPTAAGQIHIVATITLRGATVAADTFQLRLYFGTVPTQISTAVIVVHATDLRFPVTLHGTVAVAASGVQLIRTTVQRTGGTGTIIAAAGQCEVSWIIIPGAGTTA